MKKAKLEEYLGKQVKITLFNKDIITGVLHKKKNSLRGSLIYIYHAIVIFV